MSMLADTGRPHSVGLLQWLDASVCVGCQYGKPVVVSVREVLSEVPCFLLFAAVVGALILF